MINEIRQRAGTMPADEEPLDGPALVADAIRAMLNSHHIRRRKRARDRIQITPDGMTWLAEQHPATSWDDLETIKATMFRITAKLARANETLEAKQASIEHRLVDLDRDVFRRVIPFFALFAAVFALINATSQAVTRAFTPYAPAPDSGPIPAFLLTLAQASGVLAPVAAVILVLLLATWFLVRFIP